MPVPRVFIHVTMSLDGFIAGPDDDMAWVFKYGADDMVTRVMQEIGAVVLGRRTFDLSLKTDQLPYGAMLNVPMFVVTHERRGPQSVGGLRFTFVDSLHTAVEKAKASAMERNVALLGASIDQQCLQAGLVDEIMIHLAPMVLGAGVRLVGGFEGGGIHLERKEVVATAQVTSFRFTVVKPPASPPAA